MIIRSAVDWAVFAFTYFYVTYLPKVGKLPIQVAILSAKLSLVMELYLCGPFGTDLIHTHVEHLQCEHPEGE